MRWLKIKDAMKEYSLSRNVLVGIINKHPNCAFRIGRTIRIDADALDEVFRTNEKYRYNGNLSYKGHSEVNNNDW